MRKLAIALLAAACLLLVAGCSNGHTGSQKQETQYTAKELKTLDKAEPFPRLLDSGDRRIQNYYYTAEADPGKIWYLTTLALDGTPIATYTIRGPVESTNDQITNPLQQICRGGSNGDKNCDTVGLAEPNGVYQGDHGDEYVAVLTSGAILKFRGDFQVSDQPLKIVQKPKLSIDESAPISNTDLNKTAGGTRPPRR